MVRMSRKAYFVDRFVVLRLRFVLALTLIHFSHQFEIYFPPLTLGSICNTGQSIIGYTNGSQFTTSDTQQRSSVRE